MNVASNDPAATLRQAFDCARMGQLQRASALCAEVLHRNAEHAEAWLLRAVIAIQTGDATEAAASARRSIRSNPLRGGAAHALLGDALLTLRQPREALESYEAALLRDGNLVSAHFGRGSALLDLKRPDQALRCFDEVLRYRPDDAEALFIRGNALFELKEPAAAVESYDRAVAVRPAYAAALNNRGSALLLLRKPEAALASFDAALTISPEYPEALYHRAVALRLLSAHEDALQSFARALSARPEYLEALVGRGELLRELKRPTDALLSFERGMVLRPDCAAALRGRGDALLDLGRPQEALAAHDAALRLGSERSEALNSRGNSLRALGRYAEAIAAYDESLRLDPDNATVQGNRAHALMQCEDRIDEALVSYSRALELDPDTPELAGSLLYTQICRADWSAMVPSASRENVLRSVLAGKPVCAPFAFLSITDSASAQLECARSFAMRTARIDSRRSRQHRHQRIRVAYVSPDLGEHAVSYLMAGVLERHDRRRFETYAVSLRPAQATAAGERTKNAFHRFIDVSKSSDQEVAELMRSLEIDIAVDLTGYTRGFRPQIFGHDAAPIQVSYLGYPGTLGAPFMDYLIADEFVIPPQKRPYYSEAIVYLPDCFQANDDRRAISERSFSRAAERLPEDCFVYCCLNNSHKINPSMFDIWMRLLALVPASVLWLLGHEPAVNDNLRREAASRGIDADRLVFAERIAYAEYLSRLRLADLFLDTLPFNAGATASDALWAGVPLLTCAGDAFAARMAGSLLRAAGVPELITFSTEEYESKALELARSPEKLRGVRQRLTQNRRTMPLFDTGRFTRHLEAAYEEMWRRHESGSPPSGFSVHRS
jgi:predicted O-linked N-acetylglucosamine transferase (SPINDLY family)